MRGKISIVLLTSSSSSILRTLKWLYPLPGRGEDPVWPQTGEFGVCSHAKPNSSPGANVRTSGWAAVMQIAEVCKESKGCC